MARSGEDIDVIEALDQLDVKALSYVQLRRFYQLMTDAMDGVAKELELRKEEDNEGDTVRVPARPAG